MFDEDKEKIIWRQYPDYPFIEANQFGQVRTRDRVVVCKNGRKQFVKGRILKQRLNSSGYLNVSFRVKGKQVSLLVHRICATCFIPNPLNLPEINHIDNNPTNNVVSNLEWCSHEYNMAYRERCGVSAREAAKILRKPVFAVYLKTGDVLKFKSQSEAARRLKVPEQNISRVVKGKLNQAGGYLFVEDESEITEEKIQKTKSRVNFCGGVIAISLEALEVFRFESQSEAARQLRVNCGNMNLVLKGRLKKTHGYWFCYADENAVKNVEAKFCGEMANKVKKLMDN